jgi:hypothetical protein
MKSFYQLNEDQQNLARRKAYQTLLADSGSAPTQEELEAYVRAAWFPAKQEVLLFGIE